MEVYVGCRVCLNNRCYTKPLLSILLNVDVWTIAINSEANGEVTTIGIECLSVAFLNLNERLNDLDNSYVNQLNSTIVDSLRTFDGYNVARTEAPTVSTTDRILTLITLLVESTIDIYITSTVVDVPVTILVVWIIYADTSYTIGLGLRTSEDLSTSSILYRSDTLNHIDALCEIAASKDQFSCTTFSSCSRERNGSAAST